MTVRDLLQWRPGFGALPDHVLDTPVYVLARSDGRVFPSQGLGQYLAMVPAEATYLDATPDQRYFDTTIFYLAADSKKFFDGANLVPHAATIRAVLRATAWFGTGIKNERFKTPAGVKTASVMLQAITDGQITEVVIEGSHALEMSGEPSVERLPDGFAYPPLLDFDDARAYESLRRLPRQDLLRLTMTVLEEVTNNEGRLGVNDVVWRAVFSFDGSDESHEPTCVLIASLVGGGVLSVKGVAGGNLVVSSTEIGREMYENYRNLGNNEGRDRGADPDISI